MSVKIGAVLMVIATATLSYGAHSGDTIHRQESKIVTVPWTPPQTTIDAEYITAAKSLLGNGLGDPRGGRFCKVVLASPPERYGWVLPDGKRAVLLDGVEYPITRVIEPAELEVGIKKDPSFYDWQESFIRTSTPALPVLLLLVGRVDLAEQTFDKALKVFAGNSSLQLFGHFEQRYERLAGEDLWTRRDLEGLGRARQLLVVATLQEKSRIRPTPNDGSAPGINLEFIRILLGDFQRRVRHPRHEPVDTANFLRLRKSRRIGAFIDSLDTVSNYEMRDVGGRYHVNEPLLKLLKDQIEEAVPALIGVLESDRRLTRVSVFESHLFGSHDIEDYESIHSVKEVAGCLLADIWPSFNGGSSTRAMRDAWRKQAKLTQPERWLEVLRDDQAGGSSWLTAAQFMVRPANEEQRKVGTTMSGDPSAPMSGEPLRVAHNAELIRLLAARAVQIAAVRKGSSLDVYSCCDALNIGNCLAKWDLASSADSLRLTCKSALDVAKVYIGSVANVDYELGTPFGLAIANRVKSGDTTAAADYAKFLQLAHPEGNFLNSDMFRPLWESTGDSGIRLAGESYMERWGESLSSQDTQLVEGALMAATGWLPASPLLTVASYRRLLIRGLKNSHPIGYAHIATQSGTKYVAFTLEGGGGGSWGTLSTQTPGSMQEEQVPMTVGDFLAQGLSGGFKGAPAFSVLWPESKRAEARMKMIAWLQDDSRDWMSIVKTSPLFKFSQGR